MRVALTYNERRTAREAEAEFDTRETIAAVAGMLAGLGHTVVPIDVTGSIPRLVARLRRLAPDVVFNLAEGEHGRFREAFYPALFEQLGLAHTGSGASALSLCLDKALAKRVVAAAGVAVAAGRLIRTTDELAQLAPIPPPLIAKPNYEGSSKGITAASVVTDRAALATVVERLLDRYPDGVVVEAFVDGIDVAVGWVAGLGVLAPIGYRYRPTGAFAILDYTLKHGPPEDVRVEVPARLSSAVTARIVDATARSVAALGVAGYARADFRVTPAGDVVFLEMNPLPTLEPDDNELYLGAARHDCAPRDVLARILAAARGRQLAGGLAALAAELRDG